MKKFEYTTTRSDTTDDKERVHLNKMGQEGWELVSVDTYGKDRLGGFHEYYWKREIENELQQETN